MLKEAVTAEPKSAAHATPLCVDLDGTLIRSDLLVEGLLAILGRPQGLLKLPRLLTGSRAALKQRVEEIANLDAALLPYNEAFVAYLREQKALGRKLVLATAADAAAAAKVAAHLGIFDEVISSDGVTNLKAETKARVLEERFGKGGFSYAGNDTADLPILRAAKSVVLVNAASSVRHSALESAELEAEFHEKPPVLRSAIRAMRPYQWVKNILVFVPMVMAHALGDIDAWLSAALVFAAFCATASGIYVVNDLSDLAADRRHPRKRKRPFASGALSARFGFMLALALLGAGAAFAIASGAWPIVALYAVSSILYSWILKEFPLVDVFMLAGLYTVRILAGGIATGHAASLWLLAFSGFLFLSLALVKRSEELAAVLRSGGERAAVRRGYHPSDLQLLQSFGCASAFSSAVVLALFVGSSAAMTQYSSPEALWGIVPLMLFWQCRLWLSSFRGYMHDDPIVYAARDWVSWLVAVSVVALLLIAR